MVSSKVPTSNLHIHILLLVTLCHLVPTPCPYSEPTPKEFRISSLPTPYKVGRYSAVAILNKEHKIIHLLGR